MITDFCQAHIHPGRVSVANDVGERFLKNAEEGCVQVLIEQSFLDRCLDPALKAGLALELIGLPFNGRQQAGRVQQPGPQFGGDATDRVDDFINALGHGAASFMELWRMTG